MQHIANGLVGSVDVSVAADFARFAHGEREKHVQCRPEHPRSRGRRVLFGDPHSPTPLTGAGALRGKGRSELTAGGIDDDAVLAQHLFVQKRLLLVLDVL